MLAGLKTAFWASVVGVGGALTIKLRHFFTPVGLEVNGSGADGEITAADLAKLLQGIQQALVGSDDSTLVSQLKLSRQDTNDRLDALKEAQREALLKLSDDVAKLLQGIQQALVGSGDSTLLSQLKLSRQDINDRLDDLKKAQEDALLKLSEMGSKSLVEALRDVIKDFNSKLTEQFGDNFKQLNEAVGRLLVWQEQYKAHIEEMAKRQMEIVDSMSMASDHYSQLVNKADTFTNIATDLSTLLTSLETQKQQLIGALKSLSNLLTAASGSLPEIEKKVMELTRQLANSVEANQKEISKTLVENTQLIKTSIQAVGRELDSINQAFNQHLGALAEETNKQISVIGGSVISLTDQLTSSAEANQKEIGRALTENTQLIRASIEEVEQDLSSINQKFNQHLGDLAEKTDKQVLIIGDKVINLTDKLTSAVETNQKEISKALAENVQFIRTSIQGVEQDFAKINQDLNKQLEELAGKTVKQVSILDAALTEELKKSLESLGRQLAALSEKFVSDYSPLTDKLRDLVSMAKELS
ncbi:MAG: hypothetical protein ACU4EQ_12000 [Candidatus Nitrosoglobus sp.]